MLLDANGQVWIVTHCGKTEGQTNTTVFIPGMLPDDYDTHTSVLYYQFLWVTNNKLLDSDALSLTT
jgi:hypothetical protein